MKRIVFLIIASVLVIGLVLPGCGGGTGNPTIKIGICGPMEYIQGIHMMWGAEMARDEINTAGGVNVGGTIYDIELVEKDTKEINPPTAQYPGQKVEEAITVNGASFILGGFRTEATVKEIDAAMANDTIFIISGAATTALTRNVNDDYANYKYLFRGTPYNDTFLFNNTMMILGQLGTQIAGTLAAMNATVVTPRVGIIAEDLTWTSAMVAAIEGGIGLLSWNHTGTRLVEDDATDLSGDFAALGDTHIIYVLLSGPVGVTYGTQHKSLDIKCMTTGINVEAQSGTYWDNTSGGALYELSLGTYVTGVSQTVKTAPFIAAFDTKTTGEIPVYNAATYDSVYTLKAAIEAVGGFDATKTDAIITWLEANPQVTTGGVAAYYPSGYPSPLNQHDLVYGPGFVTGLGTQWMGSGSNINAIWPVAAYGALYNQLDQTGNNWTGFTYAGVVNITLDSSLYAEWMTWVEP